MSRWFPTHRRSQAFTECERCGERFPYIEDVDESGAPYKDAPALCDDCDPASAAKRQRARDFEEAKADILNDRERDERMERERWER